MRSRLTNAVKSILFFALLGGAFIIMCSFFQPLWDDYSCFNTARGFYNEPCDTIETVFLGSSVVPADIIPIELYDGYGICSYSLGTSSQPVMASYYWLKEAYKLHEKTMSTVVFDVSMLRRMADIYFYQTALDGMKFSRSKMEAIHAYNPDLKSFIERSISLFAYHDKWPSMEPSDYAGIDQRWNDYCRGYDYHPLYSIIRYIDRPDDHELPHYYLDNSKEPMSMEPDSLEYFEKIVQFCLEHQLKLVLIKTPTAGNWNDEAHLAIEKLSISYGLDFFDFNFLPYIDEINYESSLDQNDIMHMNHFGAVKLTNTLGRYLAEYYGNRDVRGEAGYSHLERQLEEYRDTIALSAALETESDICAYLSRAMERPNNMLFLSMADDASNALTDEQRAWFKSHGLDKLSRIGYGDPYLAIIEGNAVVAEMSLDDSSESSEAGVVSIVGQTTDGKKYSITSGDHAHGYISSLNIDGIEYSLNRRGINTLVYDCDNHIVIHRDSFDTFATPIRRDADPDLAIKQARENGTPWYELPERVRKVWLYDRRFDNSKYESYWNLFCSRDQLFEYLSPYVQNKDYTIYIAVQDDAANTFDDATRAAFAALGLTELSQLQFRDSYIGIIDDGAVYFEQRDHGESPITYNGIDFHIASGGLDSGNCSEIFIHDRDCSWHWRGLNIVVYDKELQSVISQIAFDTCETPIDLSASERRDDAA